MPRVHIDVMLKDEILDPQGQAVERALPSLGFDDVVSVRIGKHVVVELDDETGDAAAIDAQVQQMAGKLLVNPVIEHFTYRVER